MVCLLVRKHYSTMILWFRYFKLFGYRSRFVLILWAMYSKKDCLKKTFYSLVYLTFGLHLISISVSTIYSKPYWFVFIIILAATAFYFLQSKLSIWSSSP
jgi:hypothetical protein